MNLSKLQLSALRILIDHAVTDPTAMADLSALPATVVARCAGLTDAQRTALTMLGSELGAAVRERQRRRGRRDPLFGAVHLARLGVSDDLIARIVSHIDENPNDRRRLHVEPWRVFDSLRTVSDAERQTLRAHARTIAQIIRHNAFGVGSVVEKPRGQGGPSGLDDDPGVFLGLQWRPAQLRSIEESDHRMFTGRVRDVAVTAGGEVAVASDRGGVWRVTAAGDAECLADWEHPVMQCIATGSFDAPNHVHLFAGGERLYETIGASSLSDTEWQEIPTDSVFIDRDSVPLGGVFQIAVDREANRLYLACAIGVVSAPIPAPYAAVRAYTFQIELDTRPQPTWGIVVCNSPTGRRVVVTMQGTPGGIFSAPTSAPSPLPFTAAVVRPVPSPIARLRFNMAARATASITTLLEDDSVLYAAVANADASFSTLLKSTDGGLTWAEIKITNYTELRGDGVHDPKFGILGGQGEWFNNAIGAARGDAGDMIVIGWVRPVLSQDGGATWINLGARKIHDDIHACRFHRAGGSRSRLVGSRPTLFLATDGGLASTTDLGAGVVDANRSWEFGYNTALHILEFGNGATEPTNFNRFGISPDIPGYAVAGLQDNGILRCDTKSQDSTWVQVDTGDGGGCVFLADGAVVWWNNANNSVVRASLPSDVDAGDFSNNAFIPLRTNSITHFFLSGPKLMPVARPARGGPLAFAIGGTQLGSEPAPNAFIVNTCNVFALHQDSDSAAGYSWSMIASLEPIVGRPLVKKMIAVGYGEWDSPIPLASMEGGRLFAFVPFPQELTIPSAPSGPFEVAQILPARSPSAAAYLIVNDYAGNRGLLMSVGRDLVVRPVNGLPTNGDGSLFGLAYDDINDTLFVATESTVYRRNKTGIWSDASWGLPVNPKCQNLVCVAERDGEISLYLSTCARSMWVARVASWLVPVGPPQLINVPHFIPTVR